MKLYGLLVLVVVLHAGLTYAAQAQSSATEAPQSLPTIRVSPRVFSQLDCRPDGICKGEILDSQGRPSRVRFRAVPAHPV